MKISLSLFVSTALIFLFINPIFASEGTAEIQSLTQEPYRCWAASVKMQNSEFKIPFTCRYLIYPADDNVFNYIMWATPLKGNNPIKLGVLGYGRGEFKTKTPFSNLYVTTEGNKDTKKPSGNIVMRGTVQAIDFIEKAPSPTPTPQAEEEKQEQTQTQTQQLSTRDKLILAFKRAGIAALFALVILIGLVFVVTRSRG